MSELFMPLPKDGADYPCTVYTGEFCPNKATKGMTPETYQRVGMLVLRKTTSIISSMRAVCDKHADLIEEDLRG